MRGSAIIIAIFISQYSTGYGKAPERPTFSDVFTVEIGATFVKQGVEIDATLYYDGPNNRAVVDMLYQNEDIKKIYLFNDKEILTISAMDCNVEAIDDDPSASYLPFSINETTEEMTISPPEEIFHFHESKFKDEGSDGFQPLYVYKGKTNIYGQKDCDVSHGFTKPDFSMGNCDLRGCKSTLRSIILNCPTIPNDGEITEIYHRYDFFRFRNIIEDYDIFQPDKGIFCQRSNTSTTEEFRILPKYISFSYNVFLRQTGIPTVAKGQNVEHRALWYDDDVKVARVDKYEENGQLLERKIYDFKRAMVYETLKGQKCIKSPAEKILTIEDATTLPEIIFPLRSTNLEEKALYVGQRMTQGFQYDVWSSKVTIGDDEMRLVREFYFIKKYSEGEQSDEYKLQLAFIQQYAYGSADDTRNLQLLEEKSFYLNKFSTSPRELISFDVSDCFDDPKDKLSFEIEITGSTTDSFNKNQFMAIFFLKLITISEVAAVRIGNLKMVYQTEDITTLTGVIIEKLTISTSTSRELADNSEPDMTTAFEKLKSEVYKKKFSFTLVTENQRNLKFQAKYFGEPRKYSVEGVEEETMYTGGAMGALAIVMLGIGAIIGGLGVFIYRKSRPKKDSMIDLTL